MHAAVTGYDYRLVFRAFPEHVAFRELKNIVLAVHHSGWRAHHSEIDQAPVSLHDPFHDREHLLRATHIDNLQMSDAVEHGDVVVAHVRRAVSPGFKIGSRRKHSQVQAMALAQPSLQRPDGFQAFLVPDRDAAQNLSIEKRAERADPRVVTQGREGFAYAHHVGFRHTYIQRPRLIDGGDTCLQAAGGR